jgi:hypothetical protein
VIENKNINKGLIFSILGNHKFNLIESYIDLQDPSTIDTSDDVFQNINIISIKSIFINDQDYDNDFHNLLFFNSYKE